jgi:fucokinase
MPYCIENGGEVINAAVKVNGMLPIRVEAMRLDAPVLEMCNDDAGGRIERYVPGEAFPALSDCNLHRAVFSTVGIGPHTVLHSGVRLSVSVSGLMKGSGLGTSSILLYGCFQALNGLLGLRYTETDVLYAVFIAEQLMHTGGGWQDQGGIVCGGFKAVRSAPGIRQKITVEPLACGSAFLRTLSERLVLVSTKQRHFGRYIVTDVMNRYLEGQPQTLRAFGALTDLNAVFREAIAQGDLTKFANGINLHAEALEKLSPLIYNNIINEFSSECRRYTDACSLCGAGGGGYMAAVLKEGVTGRRLADLLHTEVLPVEII